MRFRYTDIQNHQDPGSPFHRPYLIVRLQNDNRHKDVIALVDSGADVCLFHSDIGRMLGIEIEAAPELGFQGVSGVREVAYLHRIDLVVRGVELDNAGSRLPEFNGSGNGFAWSAWFLRTISTQLSTEPEVL